MKTLYKFRKLLPAAVGVLLFVLGWLIGARSREDSDYGAEGRIGVGRGSTASATARSPGEASGEGGGRERAQPVTAERLREVLSMADPVKRAAEWAALLAGATEEDMQRIDDALMEKYRQGWLISDEDAAVLHYRQGQVLGERAVLLNLPIDPDARLGTENARKMRGWAAAEPNEAKAWAMGREPGPLRDELLTSWYEGVVKADPAGAARWYDQMPENLRSGAMQPLIVAMYGSLGNAGAVAWLEGESAREDTRMQLPDAWKRMAWLVGQRAGTDPGAATAFLRDPNHAPWITPDVFNHTLRNLTGDAPSQAVELLTELNADGKFDDSAVRRVLQYTASRARGTGLNEMATWLNAHSSHPLHDLTVRYFVEQVVKDDPGAAAAWLQRITDPALRAEVAHRVPPAN